ncbi:MAG: cytochrome c [Verrucomicrobia subdivision 3 bacterium]|nr:cytochrome c [Limisphaerales bacterium]
MKKLILALAICAGGAGTASAADVKQNWEKHCLKCHGADGKGNTKMGKQSGVKDYTDPKVQAEMKDENAIKVIKEGIVEKGKKKMDPYGDKLNDEEIKALIAHMRSFKR